MVEGLFAPLLFASSSPAAWPTQPTSISTARNIAITTDSFVVKPLSFPGGSIGELAVNGTLNDLAVSGASAEAMVVTFVLEAVFLRRCSKPKYAPWERRRAKPES